MRRRMFPLSRTFMKLFFAYLSVMLLLLMSFAVFYSLSANLIKKQIETNGLKDISRISLQLDRSNEELRKLLYDYTTDFSLLHHLDAKPTLDFYDFYILRKLAAQTVLFHDFIEDLVFYIPESEYIVTSHGSYLMEDFFSKHLVHEKHTAYFWKNDLQKRGNEHLFPMARYRSVELGQTTSERQLLVLSANSRLFQNMRLMVLIKADRFQEICGEDCLVLDRNRQTIFSSVEEGADVAALATASARSGTESARQMDRIPWSRSQAVAFYQPSQSNDWIYYKIVPYERMFAELNRYSRIGLLVVLAITAVSLVLSYYYSFSFYRPIKRVADLVNRRSAGPEQTERRNELQYIHDSLDSIYHEYQSMERKYEKMRHSYTGYVYEKQIMNVDIRRKLQIDEFQEGIFDFSNFLVIHYRIFYKTACDVEQMSRVVQELMALLLDGMRVPHHSFQLNQHAYISIVMLESDVSFDLERYWQAVNDMLEHDADNLYILLSASGVYHGSKEFKAAYDEAIRMFSYHTLAMDNQLMSKERAAKPFQFVQPKSASDKIRFLIDQRQLEEAAASVQRLLEELERRQAPAFHVKVVMMGVLSPFLEHGRSSDGMKQRHSFDWFDHLAFCTNRTDYEKLMEAFLRSMSENPGEETSGNRHQVVEKMVRHIQEHYDQDLSLVFFADRYKMSHAYLSKLFKEQTGETFTEYLNRLRLEHAVKSLIEEDIQIQELAVRVGYRDSNIFIKAFRRQFGVSPGKYRKMHA
ncbi:helix-turn-helix transcriptional regulator [Paenibacillaceae bacterium WGS1546]|uniref:helix-turn-helix transcriptional regulator n=1 Tax=Cohnella sp. WGS1546 TaxID=3366810 RepID=UPI00372CE79B